MVVFWATALAALWLAMLLAERRRKFETASVAFLAALLFAFPTVRNNLPGNPPIGSLNDFLAFFWTEGIVALALVAILITYCLRLLPGAKPPDE
jgi:integral membrane sensor domain MASE1